MKLQIVLCAIVLGSFAASEANPSTKCDACKNFIQLSGHVDETICANACTELSEEAIDSAELLLVQLGCNGCLSLATRITRGINTFSFHNIIGAVNRGCTASIPNCHAFVESNEDELIDAIYHYKKNSRSICHAVHQC